MMEKLVFRSLNVPPTPLKKHVMKVEQMDYALTFLQINLIWGAVKK